MAKSLSSGSQITIQALQIKTKLHSHHLKPVDIKKSPRTPAEACCSCALLPTAPKQSQPSVTVTAPLVTMVLHAHGSGWRKQGSTLSPAGCSSPITWQQRPDCRNGQTPQSSFRTATIFGLPSLVCKSQRPGLNKSRVSELVPKPRPHTSHGSNSIGTVQAGLTAPATDLGISTLECTSHNQDLRSSQHSALWNWGSI